MAAEPMELPQGDLRLRNKLLKHVETRRSLNGGTAVATAGEDDGGGGGVVEEEEPLSPASVMFHEPDFNVYVIAVMGVKIPLDPEELKRMLVHTMLKHPRFTSLQVRDERESGGGMKWVPTKVDLANHVIVPEIDVSGGGPPEKLVEDYIFELSKTRIDPSRHPMWDIHVLNFNPIPGGGRRDAAVAILRAHHSLGDGTSLMSLLLACTRRTADPALLPTMPVKKKEKEGGGGWRLWAAAVGFLMIMWNTVVDVGMFMATAWFLKDTETPLKGPPGLEYTPRRFVHRTVSLEDIKLVKNAMNTTINDVALGMAQAGLSRYLNRKYGAEENSTEKINNLPKGIRLRSTLLINLRPAGMQALADMMEKESEAKWGNWIGFVVLPFRIALRDDPLDYVREAKATVDRKKNSYEALFTFSLSDVFLKLFGIKAAGAVSHRIMAHTTMCFSNLAGPAEEIAFHGYPITFLAPSSYGQPHGLMINFQSYGEQMNIVLSVDEDTIPDAHRLADDLVDALRLIRNAVVSAGLHKT